MLSKLFGWISGGSSSNEKVDENERNSPPRVPEKTVSLKDHLQNGSIYSGYQQPPKSKETFVAANGDVVPRALASAFEKPEKDKKPFTYFTGGRAPDLSQHPSPKTVRKENPQTNAPTVPRVLPIVSDEELQREEQRVRTPSPMPNISHMQYNSPLPLYSRENVQVELNRATGQQAPANPQFNIQQSGAYKLLHAGVPEQHSARLDEPSSTDYPRYRGFVNPNIQSPSFKRLQYVAGLHSDSEDEQQAVEIRQSTVHAEEESRRSRGGVNEQQQQLIALGYGAIGDQGQTFQENQAMPSAGYQGGPQWSTDGPPILHYDPVDYDDRGRTPDPNFMAKIAEAERPKVPPVTTPSWARKAEQKHQKWQGYAGGGPGVVESAPAPRPYAPVYSPPVIAQPVPSYRTTQQRYAPEPIVAKPRYEIRTYSTSPHRGAGGRAKSSEPPDWRQSRPKEKEPWMKPYIAPNVLGARFSPSAPRMGRTSTSPSFRTTYYTTDSYGGTPAGGQYYGRGGSPGLGGGTDYSKRTSSTYSRRTDRSSSPYRIQTTYAPPREPPVTTVALREPSWRSESTSSRMWQHETEARRRQREMEEEVSKRSYSAGPSSRSPQYGGAVTQWQPTDRTVSNYSTTTGPAVTQKWQDASGASTKTQSQGSYLDADGNTVNYVKEVYTTSDPGKEFSMLTQEEKKVLEEPLQPGVISRHITTKYYKKSTYTSTTTSSTSQTPPTTSYPRRLQIGPGESQY